MLLFFNLEKLEKRAGNDVNKFLKLIEQQINIPSITKLAGLSFLLNPAPLLKSANYTDKAFIVQYIKLAARRNYFDYTAYNQASLDTSFFPDIIMQNVKHNPLLRIDNKHIYFKFEELYNGTKIFKHKG